MPEPTTEPPREPSPPPTATPFVVALVLVAALAALAVLFLRDDDRGELVRPDRVVALDERTVEVVAFDQPPCRRIARAQVDADDARVLVELVAVPVDGCDGGDPVDVVAEVGLPDGIAPIGDRRLVAGVGRTRVPCSGRGPSVTCAPAP